MAKKRKDIFAPIFEYDLSKGMEMTVKAPQIKASHRSGMKFTGVAHKTIEEANAYMNGFRDGALNTKPTLRQWYAGMALQTLIHNPKLLNPKEIAKQTFLYADAMIEFGGTL